MMKDENQQQNTAEVTHSNHQSSHGHKGHGWMMILCLVAMIAIPLAFIASDKLYLGSVSWYTTAALLLLCLAVHGLMMKWMMPNHHQDEPQEQRNKQIE